MLNNHSGDPLGPLRKGTHPVGLDPVAGGALPESLSKCRRRAMLAVFMLCCRPCQGKRSAGSQGGSLTIFDGSFNPAIPGRNKRAMKTW